MKSSIRTATLVLALAAMFGGARAAEGGDGKEPTAKVFLAETKGGGQIHSKGQVFEPKQGTAYEAAGTSMSTGKDSHQAYVLSSGTGIVLEANSEVRIDQFTQERFHGTAATDVAPSASHISIGISRGMVGACAPELVSGTTLVFTTPLASVNIRGRRTAIQVTPEETVVYLLEGSVTVVAGNKDGGSVTLQPGERAVIRADAAGQAGPPVVEPIDAAGLAALDTTLSTACNARRTVAFEAVDAANGETEIVPRPAITAQPPNNLTVSPDRLNPGT